MIHSIYIYTISNFDLQHAPDILSLFNMILRTTGIKCSEVKLTLSFAHAVLSASCVYFLPPYALITDCLQFC